VQSDIVFECKSGNVPECLLSHMSKELRAIIAVQKLQWIESCRNLRHERLLVDMRRIEFSDMRRTALFHPASDIAMKQKLIVHLLHMLLLLGCLRCSCLQGYNRYVAIVALPRCGVYPAAMACISSIATANPYTKLVYI
jgi:hypothetical protein